MGAEVRDRRQMEHDLRQAVARDEFRLVYQPQTDVETRTRSSASRRCCAGTIPSRGIVPPGVFIPVAEDSGAILQIGEWVMRTACREAASWTHTLTIAINVSALQIYNEGFVQLVHGILLETGLSPSRLELEITETAMVRDLQRALNALRQIKALGVRIAMDDFGTGYSSLSNLRAFPFDKIKIDGSFVKSVNTNEQAATIVRAVLGLGRGLGLPVLAEGVETRAELAFLEQEQCGEVQGYFMGRPADIGTLPRGHARRSRRSGAAGTSVQAGCARLTSPNSADGRSVDPLLPHLLLRRRRRRPAPAPTDRNPAPPRADSARSRRAAPTPRLWHCA